LGLRFQFEIVPADVPDLSDSDALQQDVLGGVFHLETDIAGGGLLLKPVPEASI
jgi:hypothetical protein